MVRRRQDKAWTEFDAWCRARRLCPLPAHPWTVAAYLRWCERRHRVKTIVARLQAIARYHVLACRPPPHRHPVVTRTLRLIEAKARGRLRGAALFRAEDFLDGKQPPARAAEPEPRTPTRRRSLRSSPRLVVRRPAEG